MMIQILYNNEPCDAPCSWPYVMCEGEPLAEDDVYDAISDLQKGEEFAIGGGYSVRRTS